MENLNLVSAILIIWGLILTPLVIGLTIVYLRWRKQDKIRETELNAVENV